MENIPTRNTLHKVPGSPPDCPPKRLKYFSYAELHRAYTSILRDAEGAGACGPMAYAIRQEWLHKGYPKGVLDSIEKRFKGTKRGVEAQRKKY